TRATSEPMSTSTWNGARPRTCAGNQGFDMKRVTFALSACLLAAATFPAYAQDSGTAPAPSLPGSVFVLPEGDATPVPPEEDPEVISDIEYFRAKGFEEPDWQTHTAQVDDVLRDVVLPDWRKRTGSETDPQLPSIDIAAANVLGGSYNDLLVMS